MHLSTSNHVTGTFYKQPEYQKGLAEFSIETQNHLHRKPTVGPGEYIYTQKHSNHRQISRKITARIVSGYIIDLDHSVNARCIRYLVRHGT